MQQSIVKFYCFVVQTLLNMFRSLLCPSSGDRQTAVAASGFPMNVEVEVFSAVVGLLVSTHIVFPLTNRPRLRTLPPLHSQGNQRLQRQFDGLLMMGILMPETCWAVSVRQSNKVLRLIVTSSWVFYLSQLYMFRAMFSPIISSTWLYLQHLVIFTNVAAGLCHGWVGTQFPAHSWHQPAAILVNMTRCCKYSQVFLMMGENIARNM